MTTKRQAKITVTIRFVGVLHEVFRKKQMRQKFSRSPTVKEIVEKLADTSINARRSMLETESDKIHPALLVMVNGKEIGALDGAETRVKDGEEVVLVSVSHGG